MVNVLFTTVTSSFSRIRVKGSVSPLIYEREAKDLCDSVGSTILKNIPASSSGDTLIVEDRVFLDELRWITVGLRSYMNII